MALRNTFIYSFMLDARVVFHLRELRATFVRDAVLAGAVPCQAALVRYVFGSFALCSRYICHMSPPLLPW